MLLQPRKMKYRRIMNPPLRKGPATKATRLSFGEFGIKALSTGWVTARQLEAARRAITHYTKRGGRIWFRVFPDRPVTKKSGEAGMGKGKGPVDHFAFPVQRGRIILELGGVEAKISTEALRRASHKLPMRTRIVSLEDYKRL